jgi:hypothetical protein
MYTAKRILLKELEGERLVPALAIERLDDGRTVVVEADPVEFGRRFSLGGRSQVYFLGAADSYEVIDEVEVSYAVIEAAKKYVSACAMLHAQASMFGALGELSLKGSVYK